MFYWKRKLIWFYSENQQYLMWLYKKRFPDCDYLLHFVRKYNLKISWNCENIGNKKLTKLKSTTHKANIINIAGTIHPNSHNSISLNKKLAL